MAPHNRTTKTGILAVLALVGMALLSGCAGLSSGGADENRAPVARLDADKDKAWAGDQFTFDAQDSTDPDGNVTQWRFDFGDGTHMNVTDPDTARVKHAYVRGGEYVATVTVIDDGTGEGLGEKADKASVRVAVNDRTPVALQAVKTGLSNNSAGSRMAMPFEVRKDADRTVANVTLRNLLVAGASEVQVLIHDPDGTVIANETYTLASAETKDIDLSADVDQAGNHTLELVALSGAARLSGEQQVLYGEDFDEALDEA